MLFDEKDLRIFENTDSRSYFKEILQSFYSQNYRATIVLLYSFVIYDLYLKLQTMANEGNTIATNKLLEINSMIADDEKYSKVENAVIFFFKKHCSLYFNRFIEDIEYLKNCRNKCAHLKVNDNTLFVPKDYQVRMLICSMYDNILSVKAPFILDLFSIAQADVERYSESIPYIPDNGLDDSIINAITEKYLKRMTFDSLKKSYITFIKLLFVSEDNNCIENIYGLYAFAYTMTYYIVKNGYINFFDDPKVLNVFLKINVTSLRECSDRRDALIKIISTFSVIMDVIRSNLEVFEYISNKVLLKPNNLNLYRKFYPRKSKSVYEFFKENSSLINATYSETLYNALKDCDDFNLAEFTLIMVRAIPHFNGFNVADCFTSFFIAHLEELSYDDIKSVIEIYNSNSQCTNRNRHSEDYARIKEYIESTFNK